MSIYFTYLLGVLSALLGIVGVLAFWFGCCWLGMRISVWVYDQLFTER